MSRTAVRTVTTPYGDGRLHVRRADSPVATLLLSHGAGRGVDAPDLEALAATLPAHGISVLAPAAAKGAIPLAIHPAIAFTGSSTDLRALRDAYAAVTAPAAVLPIAQALAVEMGCEPVVVADADRAAYGEAIATATEFSASIVRQSSELLVSAGVEHPGRYLSALMHTTVDRALSVAGGDPSPL